MGLRYGPAATLWRISLGWRRREQKTIYGFSVDANTGEWTKDSQAPTDAEDDAVREGKSVERITPFVEDTETSSSFSPLHMPSSGVPAVRRKLTRVTPR